MRICDLRVRIVRDGHEPNEAEEQRPCCVPIEPVHVISSPKDRREQKGYQNSGSLGENGWGDFAGVNPLSFAREPLPSRQKCGVDFATGMRMRKPKRTADQLTALIRERAALFRPWPAKMTMLLYRMNDTWE